jgi:pilus assembly protein CpaC
MKNRYVYYIFAFLFLFSFSALAESKSEFFDFVSKSKGDSSEYKTAQILSDKPQMSPLLEVEKKDLKEVKKLISDKKYKSLAVKDIVISYDKAKSKKDKERKDTSLEIAVGKSKLIKIKSFMKDIIVASPEIADIKVVNRRLVYLTGIKVGNTNVILLDNKGKIIRKIDVHVHMDSVALKHTYEKLFPYENIKVSPTKDGLVLSGLVSSDTVAKTAGKIAQGYVADAEKIVNMIGVNGEQQVLLKVRVAEMQRSVLKELGFNTTYGANMDGWILDWQGVANTGLSAGGAGASSLYGGTLTRGSFASTIQALETNGLIKTLAEPNLTAVSGEKADLLAGGEYPIPVFDSDGNVTFVFKPYGVSLAFTPVVLSSGRISLKLSTEVSSIADLKVIANATVPTMNTRRFGTTVEIPSGGSLMIAGLLQNDEINSLGGVPWIKDVPILGALFSSKSFRTNESELVVTISGYIVEPKNAQDFSLPTDGFAPASDIDRYLLGKLYKTYKNKNNSLIKGVLKGPVGYIMR